MVVMNPTKRLYCTQDDIWKPNHLRWHVEHVDTGVVTWIPLQLMIGPTECGISIKSVERASLLADLCWSQTFVVIIWFFSC